MRFEWFTGLIKRNLVLLFCVLLATALYSIGIEKYPSGFHNDEASFFLNAQYIRDTGFDEDGNRWPVYLRSFIDPKPALYSYAQIPFTYLFGDTIAAARAPSILFGAGTVVAVYFLIQALFSVQLARITTLVFAISPWTILLVRGTQEVVMSLFFGMVSLAIFSRFLVRKSSELTLQTYLSIATALGLAFLSMYAYHSAKIVIPIIFLSIFVWSRYRDFTGSINLKRLRKLVLPTTGIIAIFSAFVLFLTFSSEDGLKRFQAVSVFSQPHVQLILDEQIRTATPHLSPILIRVFHNKPVNYTIEILEKMSAYLSPTFLFFDGAQPMRYSVPRHGLLYMIEIALLAVGIVYIILSSRNQSRKNPALILVIWILASFIPGSITSQEHPSMIRTAFALPAIATVIAHGLVAISQLKLKNLRLLLLTLVGVGYLASIAYFHNQYTIQAVYLQPWNRNLADQLLVDRLQEIEHMFDQIVITRHVSGQPYVYLGLANLFEKQELQGLEADRTTGSYNLNKYLFMADACPAPEVLSPATPLAVKPEVASNTLYVLGGTCKIPKGYLFREFITYADGAEAYMLIEVDPAFK